VQRPTLSRLRRRSRTSPAAAPSISAEFAFGRGDLAPIAAGLRAHLGDRNRAIGTPDQLRTAFEDAMGARAGGSVHVHRIPAALHAPESWHVRLDSVRPEARDLAESLIAEARGVR
jgi:hypothetical protein